MVQLFWLLIMQHFCRRVGGCCHVFVVVLNRGAWEVPVLSGIKAIRSLTHHCITPLCQGDHPTFPMRNAHEARYNDLGWSHLYMSSFVLNLRCHRCRATDKSHMHSTTRCSGHASCFDSWFFVKPALYRTTANAAVWVALLLLFLLVVNIASMTSASSHAILSSPRSCLPNLISTDLVAIPHRNPRLFDPSYCLLLILVTRQSFQFSTKACSLDARTAAL